VGLFAALSLARRGVEVRIIDEEWRSSTHSYALALHPKSLELLDALDLARPLLDKARRIRTIGLYDREERRAGLDLGAIDSKFPFMAVLAQADFESLLTRALADAKVEVEWNHRLSRVVPNGDHVDVTVDTLGKETMGYAVAQIETVIEGSKDFRVPFVIGADGHDSLVRTQLGIPFESVRDADEFAVFEFAAEGDLPDEMCVVLDDHKSNVLWPMTNGRYRWSFQLPPGVATGHSREKDRLLMPLSAPEVRELAPEQLQALIEERAPWFKASIGEVLWRLGVRFEYRLASAFGKAHVCLAGDAVHMTGPVGVQSMNIGLAEAAEAAEAIASILKGKGSVDALALYNTRHVGEWSHLLQVGGPELEPTDAALDWTREHAGELTPCIPASGEHFSRLAEQLGLHARTD
jgi:2-polyprenyl-6-methoxyphenol hydroxylase-like FAD-dependent oxidoreductase